MTPPRDPELDALLGAFALDALDKHERARVEEYVARDPEVQAEVDEMRETAAALALAPVDDTEAPPELWARIATEINAPEDELAGKRSPRTRKVDLWVVPVAAAVALIVGAGTVAVVGNDSDGDASSYEAAIDDGAQEISMVSDDVQVATIAWRDDGTGVVRNGSLVPLPADEVYQLWAQVDASGEAVVLSAGVLGDDPDEAGFTVVGPVEKFMITVEPAPGGPVPTDTPVAISA